jgi:hypothetical protein
LPRMDDHGFAIHALDRTAQTHALRVGERGESENSQRSSEGTKEQGH